MQCSSILTYIDTFDGQHYGHDIGGESSWYYLVKVRMYRGSYMSAHVLLNLLNELGKRDKMQKYLFFAKSLINSIIQEHEC